MTIFKKPALATLAAALALGATSPAMAEAYCTGKIMQIYTDDSGLVSVLPTFRNQWVAVCSLETTWKIIGVNTCQGWLSTLMSGMLADRAFTFYYANMSDCSAIPTYSSAPAPNYVRIYQSSPM